MCNGKRAKREHGSLALDDSSRVCRLVGQVHRGLCFFVCTGTFFFRSEARGKQKVTLLDHLISAIYKSHTLNEYRPPSSV